MALVGTKYPLRVRQSDPQPLKPGADNVKLGGVVKKGLLKGARLYQLSLEERATCPVTCGLWTRCMGNHMPFAVRQVDGPNLRLAVEKQLEHLFQRYPLVLVRLHGLGDFPSVSYIDWWESLLAQHAGLWVYGYSHRRGGAVGERLLQFNQLPKVRILTSEDWEPDDWDLGKGKFLTLRQWEDKPRDYIRCPAELTKREINCVDCTLCFPGSKVQRIGNHLH